MWSIHSINKNKGLLQWESIKTLTVGVYQISYHSRISLDSNRRQQRQRINLFDVCFLGIYERHAGFLADSVCLCELSCIPGVGGGEQGLLCKRIRNSSR